MRPEAKCAAPLYPGSLDRTGSLTLKLFFILSPLILAAAPFYNVRDFGAKGDGSARDTAAIQKAIDAAEKDGGGIVVTPAGTYRSGTIHLKSNVTLQLTSGAVILASPDDA